MREPPYPLFCPVAMAAEIIEPRWTLLVLCEMWSGSSRFNEIARGVPGMSPTLLTRRLREMEARGLVRRTAPDAAGVSHYVTTPMADELEPVASALGEWAQRNIDPKVSLSRIDHRMLMWNLRRKIDRGSLPLKKCVIQFTLTEAGEAADYWLLVRPGAEPDLCYVNKGFEVDLFVQCEAQALASAFLGHSSFRSEIAAGRIALIGNEAMGRTLSRWLMKSGFAAAAPAGTAKEEAALPVQGSCAAE